MLNPLFFHEPDNQSNFKIKPPVQDKPDKNDFIISRNIEDNIAYLRKIILDIFSQKASEKIQILYGGSVNSNNFASILKSSHVDGLLVGGSCLDPFEFAKIVN